MNKLNEMMYMKKTIMLHVMSFLIVATADAQVQEGIVNELCCFEDDYPVNTTYFYGKIFSGLNFLQDTGLDGNQAQYQAGYVIACSFGYRWCCGLRLEGEYAFRRNDIDRIDFVQQGSSNQGYLETSSYMANVLWDLPLFFYWDGWDAQAFVGAGIGYDSQEMRASNSRVIFDQTWKPFSWQLMAGVACPITYHTEIILEYKFHQGGSQFCNHVIGVGIDYKLGSLE